MPRSMRADHRRQGRAGREPLARVRAVPLAARAGGQVASGFPDSMRTSLMYEVHARVNPGVVSETDTVFSVNGVFDPEISGVGHQPRLYDQYSAIYARYRVDAAHYRVIARQRAAHGLNMVTVASNLATPYNAADRPAELTRAVLSATTGSNQPVIDVSQTVLPHTVIGITKQQYQNEEDCSASVAGTPSQLASFHVYLFNPDAATVLDVDLVVLIRYDVTFYDRINPGVSVLESLRELRQELARREAELAELDAPVVVAAPRPSPPELGRRSSSRS